MCPPAERGAREDQTNEGRKKQQVVVRNKHEASFTPTCSRVVISQLLNVCGQCYYCVICNSSTNCQILGLSNRTSVINIHFVLVDYYYLLIFVMYLFYRFKLNLVLSSQPMAKSCEVTQRDSIHVTTVQQRDKSELL